ncbi:hypothetical protein K438DRAFT_1910755 [Mycena galopus ATCC 62051]|nr:hypothetical protein K438DRAFT_1910755 [Mycena galopus ATCC 62051]
MARGNEDQPAVLHPPPQQDAPPVGSPRGYVRLAVMDRKTIRHRKCALGECEDPLVNYKNGRFCQTHMNLRDICGILPCGLPNDGVHGPTLQFSIADLDDTPGNEVVHTFKAKSTYCIQTIQLACGFPIGWGKCYRSESSSQVLAILNRIWADHPDSKPSFVAYDDACSLLRHIVTQDPNNPWLSTTKLIVDAWHYVGHRATNILCHLWCNPAPVNGSQPDLILIEHDDNGLNSWLSGFKSQLREMADVNYDFFIHNLIKIYSQGVEEKVVEKELKLSDAFWAEATGN